MIAFECDNNYNDLRSRLIGGKVTSIWSNDTFYKGATSYPVTDFKYYTAEFCNFEKNISSDNSKMSYHLSGYGVLHNEAYSSFIGESSERYTFASIYRLLKDKVEIGSYIDMVKKYGEDNVCDFELLNSFFLPTDIQNYLGRDCEIQWVKMNSLIEIGEYIYVPLQFVVSNDGFMCKDEVQFMPAAVSTGTASHETFLKSLENAVIEYLQIDSFNLWWYGGAKGKSIDIDIESFMGKFFTHKNSLTRFIKHFDVKLTDISFDKDIEVVVCEVFGKDKDVPQYTVGVQGGKNYERTIYRSIMECLAVLEYNMHLPWLDNEKYINTKFKNTVISNLDDNIVFYSKYGKSNKVKHDNDYFYNISSIKTYRPIQSLKKLSKYACFLNVTLPEFEGLNLCITRISIPELLPMCLPSYPPYYHVRYKQTGGIRNEIPHPLA